MIPVEPHLEAIESKRDAMGGKDRGCARGIEGDTQLCTSDGIRDRSDISLLHMHTFKVKIVKSFSGTTPAILQQGARRCHCML